MMYGISGFYKRQKTLGFSASGGRIPDSANAGTLGTVQAKRQSNLGIFTWMSQFVAEGK